MLIEPILVAAVAFVAYLFGAAPSVTFGDAGEFAAAAAILGLPHAPDYPLYTLAARAFGAALGLGNWAYRTNLFSAACAAVSVGVFADFLRVSGCGRLSRLSAAAALGLCPLWIYHAGVTEVFAPHLLMCSALLWVLGRFAADLTVGRAAGALGFAFGLGAGIHQTLALAAPAVLVQALAMRGRMLRGACWFLAFAGLGFTCYAYLPIRAVASPPLDWGHPVDLPRFKRAVLRQDYGSMSLTTDGRKGASALEQVKRWAKEARRGLGIPLLALAAAGLFWPGACRARRATLLAWVIGFGPLFLLIGSPPFDPQTSSALERFHLASWMGLAALAAFGIEALSPVSIAAALSLATAVFPFGAAARGDYGAYDYGRAIQNSLPPGSTLIIDGGDDTFYSMAYMTYAQKRRTDLRIHDRGGLVFPSAYGPDFRSLPKEAKEPVRNAVEGEIFRTGKLYYSSLNENVLPGVKSNVQGLLRKPGAEARDLWPFIPERFDSRLLDEHYRDRALAAFYPYQRAFTADAYGWLSLALETAPDVSWVGPDVAYQAGLQGYRAVEKKDWETARRFYELQRRAAPADAEPVLNLGVVAEKSGDAPGAEALYRRAAVLDPRSARPRYNLGALHWARGDWKGAAEELDAASRLAPGDAAIAKFAAEARRRAGR